MQGRTTSPCGADRVRGMHGWRRRVCAIGDGFVLRPAEEHCGRLSIAVAHEMHLYRRPCSPSTSLRLAHSGCARFDAEHLTAA